MNARILHATKDQSGYHFLVHLDPAMTVAPHEAHELSLPAGSPHPHFVRKWDFANLTPAVHTTADKEGDEPRPLTEAEYLESIKEMLSQQSALELQGIRFYQPAPKPQEIVTALHGKEL